MKRVVLALFVPVVLTGCPREREQALTVEQATQALEESTAASEAEGLTAASVDISTQFTIGQGVEAAAGELRAFIGSQLPCAEVALSGATLNLTNREPTGLSVSLDGNPEDSIVKFVVTSDKPVPPDTILQFDVINLAGVQHSSIVVRYAAATP